MTTRISHRDAHTMLRDAIARVIGPDEPDTVVLYCQAVGWLESRYASAWTGPGVGSNNWGAIQHRSPPCNPPTVASPGVPGCFPFRDSSPQPDGTSRGYAVCFRVYATPEEGAEALVRTVYSSRRRSVLEAARRADPYAFSAAMYNTRYYEGFGPTREVRIQNHYKAMSGSLALINAGLRPSQPIEVPGAVTVLREGVQGQSVLDWQRRLNADGASPQLRLDGSFGPRTAAATRAWQAQRGLVPDGIVGPRTREAARRDTLPGGMPAVTLEKP